MKIPDGFKETQRKVFQDKPVIYRPAVESVGGLGSVTVSPGSFSASYDVNFQIISDALLAQEWGLLAGRDAFITSSASLDVEMGGFFQYDRAVYRIKGILKRDSHMKIMLELTDFEAA